MMDGSNRAAVEATKSPASGNVGLAGSEPGWQIGQSPPVGVV